MASADEYILFGGVSWAGQQGRSDYTIHKMTVEAKRWDAAIRAKTYLGHDLVGKHFPVCCVGTLTNDREMVATMNASVVNQIGLLRAEGDTHIRMMAFE
jgi:hypothetical protein